jgi:hypothetical protein
LFLSIEKVPTCWSKKYPLWPFRLNLDNRKSTHLLIEKVPTLRLLLLSVEEGTSP